MSNPHLYPRRTAFARFMTRLGLHRWYGVLDTTGNRFRIIQKCQWCHAMREEW